MAEGRGGSRSCSWWAGTAVGGAGGCNGRTGVLAGSGSYSRNFGMTAGG